MLTYMVIVHRA